MCRPGPDFAAMGTYRVFTKGLKASIRVVVEGEQVVSGLREAFVAKRAPVKQLDEASLELYLVAAPPAGVPTQAAAEAAAIPSNLMEEGAALVDGAYYLAVDTRPPAPVLAGKFHAFPMDYQHPTPRGWSHYVP